MKALTAGVLGAFVAASVVGGISSAAGTPTTFYACVHKTMGTVRMTTATKACASGYNKISWNDVGPTGPKGDAGATGAKGEPGSGTGFVLKDGTGKVLGSVAPDDRGPSWVTVWDGSKFVLYKGQRGYPGPQLARDTVYKTLDCSDPGFAFSQGDVFDPYTFPYSFMPLDPYSEQWREVEVGPVSDASGFYGYRGSLSAPCSPAADVGISPSTLLGQVVPIIRFGSDYSFPVQPLRIFPAS